MPAKAICTLKGAEYDSIKFYDMIINNHYHKLEGERYTGPTIIQEIKSRSLIAYEYYLQQKSLNSKQDTQYNKIDSLTELRKLFIELEKLTQLQIKTTQRMEEIQKQINLKLNGNVITK